MRSDEPLHILIVDKSNDEANRFISILRSADFVVEAKLATNEEQLQKTISMRNWDLLLAAQDYTRVPIQKYISAHTPGRERSAGDPNQPRIQSQKGDRRHAPWSR